VPRTVVDLVGARPIHLAIIEGVKTLTGGEGPWVGPYQKRVAGRTDGRPQSVNTDAVAMSVMGFDPMADRGTPIRAMRQHVEAGEDAGLGTRDLRRIEVIGASIAEVRSISPGYGSSGAVAGTALGCGGRVSFSLPRRAELALDFGYSWRLHRFAVGFGSLLEGTPRRRQRNLLAAWRASSARLTS